jgi:2-methylcitrate dehydratase PrpD
VIHQAKRCVLDAIGCAVGAADAPGRPMIEAVALELGGPPEATIFGSGVRTGTPSAALVNSFLVRFLDLNDVGGGGHNSDALASLLAVAEREGRNGADLLLALVASYEIGGRFADAVANHPVGTPVSSSLEEKGWTKDIRAGLTPAGGDRPAHGPLRGADCPTRSGFA